MIRQLLARFRRPRLSACEALAIRRLSVAERDVLRERRRHTEALPWSSEHDDKHTAGELAMAAAAYALNARFRAQGVHHYAPPACWPWSLVYWRPRHFRRDLVKAAALLLAEIERFDRGVESASAPAPNNPRDHRWPEVRARRRRVAGAPYVNEPARLDILQRFYGAQQ